MFDCGYYLSKYIPTGLWFQPLWKILVGWLFPIYGKQMHVPNHQSAKKHIHHSFLLAKLQTPQPSHILLSRVKGHWNVSTTRLQVDVTMLTSMPEGQRWMLDAMPSWWQLYALAILNMLIFAELIYIYIYNGIMIFHDCGIMIFHV